MCEAWLEPDGIEVLDDYTISFHLGEPLGSFLIVTVGVFGYPQVPGAHSPMRGGGPPGLHGHGGSSKESLATGVSWCRASSRQSGSPMVRSSCKIPSDHPPFTSHLFAVRVIRVPLRSDPHRRCRSMAQKSRIVGMARFSPGPVSGRKVCD